MLSLHLLQVSLVYVETLMIQQVLAEPAWQGRLTAVNLRALSPLKSSEGSRRSAQASTAPDSPSGAT